MWTTPMFGLETGGRRSELQRFDLLAATAEWCHSVQCAGVALVCVCVLDAIEWLHFVDHRELTRACRKSIVVVPGSCPGMPAQLGSACLFEIRYGIMYLTLTMGWNACAGLPTQSISTGVRTAHGGPWISHSRCRSFNSLLSLHIPPRVIRIKPGAGFFTGTLHAAGSTGS